TGKPGGFPKDALYLIGYKKVSDYLLAGGNVELLYRTQVPELGVLLARHGLLSSTPCQMPQFL
ncbi:MAG: flavohemoglobin expression-modulating QEGLA motif protein, partial [Candidatus Roizmanbacteria bacterium]|nr:flavohemoglobin expression-modulating QEGLA motif protein [Candidatus Roizmanbacteria bacterium]